MSGDTPAISQAPREKPEDDKKPGRPAAHLALADAGNVAAAFAPNPAAVKLADGLGNVGLALVDRADKAVQRPKPGDQGDRPGRDDDAAPAGPIHVTETETKFDGKKVAAETHFSRPASIQIQGVKGLPLKGLPNVSHITDYYDKDGNKAIATRMDLDTPGMNPISLDILNGQGGKLTFKPNRVDLYAPEGGQTNQLVFHAVTIFLEQPDGKLTDIQAADTISIGLDNKGVAVAALSESNKSGSAPFAYIRLGESNAAATKPEASPELSADQVSTLINQIDTAGKWSDRNAAADTLKEHGREERVIEALAAITRMKENTRNADLRAWANEILASQAKKPLPDSFVSGMQNWTRALLETGTQFSFDPKFQPASASPSPEVRQSFERLINLADRPAIAGQNQIELQTRIANTLNSLLGPDGEVLERDDQEPTGSPLADQAREFQRQLSPESIKDTKVLRELGLHELARKLPSVTRCLYAKALSESDNPDDKQKALGLLTDVVRQNPEFILNPANFSPQVRDALKNTDALTNPGFLEACNKASPELAGLIKDWVQPPPVPPDEPPFPQAPKGAPPPDAGLPPPPGGALPADLPRNDVEPVHVPPAPLPKGNRKGEAPPPPEGEPA